MFTVKELFTDALKKKWANRKMNPNVKSVRVRFPLNTEREYVKYARWVIGYVQAPFTRRVTKTAWNRWLMEARRTSDSAQHDGRSDDFYKINTEMLERQGELMIVDPSLARKGALAAIIEFGDMVDNIVEENTKDLTQYLIGQAFDLKNAITAESVLEWSTMNFERIKTLTGGHISQLNVLLREGVSYGTSWEEIAKKIQKLTNTTENHAKLIARDQIGKLVSNLTRYRQSALGIELYRWRTARDERVRSTHRKMEGVICRWDNPDLYSPNGVDWKPKTDEMEQQQVGQAIQCRCHGEAYVDDIIEEGRRFLAENPNLV